MFFRKKENKEKDLMIERWQNKVNTEKEKRLVELRKQHEQLTKEFLVCRSVIYPPIEDIYTDKFLGKVKVIEIKSLDHNVNASLDWVIEDEEKRLGHQIARLKTAIKYYKEVQREADQGNFPVEVMNKYGAKMTVRFKDLKEVNIK